jgi:hypothetical protein
MSCYKFDQVKNAVLSKGYKWFEDGEYNLNIVGVRNSSTGTRVTNQFDDCITVSFKTKRHGQQFFCYPATTDPGKHWMANLLNPKGAAILVPGQYSGSHAIGLHQGKYRALRQVKPLPVYRDSNKDMNYDLNKVKIHVGLFGINIHRAAKSGVSQLIDKWSGGCQVIASANNFSEFMGIIDASAGIYGNSFTYTLIESKDII